ncbi:MAG: DUF4837 family protein [Vicingaceae bacterium]
MIRYIKNGSFLLIVALAFACGNVKVDKASLPNSSGKYGEVLVVVDSSFENRKTGEQLEQIFYKAMVGMPQQEAMFRMSTVAPRGFQSILKRSRNVLKLSIGKGKKTDIIIERDVWAKNQLFIQITAASDEDAARILEKNRKTIRDYFNEEELKRLKEQYSIKPQDDLISGMEEKHQLSLLVPPGFIKVDDFSNGFWLKKEKSIGEHQVIQGLSVYYSPYDQDSVFKTSYMVELRNVFTEKYIQGVRDSSYMQVYGEYLPETQEINLNGSYAVEYRGLWNMTNDLMGGPFLHYTFVDEENNRVINLDGFVFAPKFNKREYLRELEAIMKSVKVVSSEKAT